MRKVVQVEERLPLAQAIPLSIQHLFAMFGASVLVPTLFGIDPAVVLLMNGVGTLLFILFTKGKAPAFLGSSFAFLTPTFIILGNSTMGYEYALGGFVVVGLVFCAVALIIKSFGTQWIDFVLPAAAMGPVVALIGLELAGVAAGSSGFFPAEGQAIDPRHIIVFFVTLLTVAFGSVVFKGFLRALVILTAIVVGYVLSLILGLVDYSAVSAASIFAIPHFQFPKFDINAILIIVPASFVVISEHIGHQLVTSKVVERDLIKDPGLHRSLMADGVSTVLSGCVGSVPTTTYGENIGVMAITRVFSVWVIGGAAVFSICIAFIGKISALITTIPPFVMSGISFLLFGMIATAGIRLMVEAKIDYSKSRNLILTSIVFITGLSGVYIQMGQVQLKGMALATVVGMVFSLAFNLLDKFNLTTDGTDAEDAEKAEKMATQKSAKAK